MTINEEPSFLEKCKFLIVPSIMAWALIFSVSLLINNKKWWLNAIITLGMILMSSYSITTFKGDDNGRDYD